jgi:hydrogenase maturation protease
VNRVIGLGNPRRGDDAVGVTVAQRLESNEAIDVEILTWDADPTRLLDRWDTTDRVILIDASSPQGHPGRLRRFDARVAALPYEAFPVSSHAVGLAAAIELGRALQRLPRVLIVYAIEGADFSLDGKLTPPVAHAVEPTADRILGELREFASSAPRS